MDPWVASPRINQYQYERAKYLPGLLTLGRLSVVLDRPLPFFYAADEDLALLIIAVHHARPAARRQWLATLRGKGRRA